MFNVNFYAKFSYFLTTIFTTLFFIHICANPTPAPLDPNQEAVDLRKLYNEVRYTCEVRKASNEDRVALAKKLSDKVNAVIPFLKAKNSALFPPIIEIAAWYCELDVKRELGKELYTTLSNVPLVYSQYIKDDMKQLLRPDVKKDAVTQLSSNQALAAFLYWKKKASKGQVQETSFFKELANQAEKNPSEFNGVIISANIFRTSLNNKLALSKGEEQEQIRKALKQIEHVHRILKVEDFTGDDSQDKAYDLNMLGVRSGVFLARCQGKCPDQDCSLLAKKIINGLHKAADIVEDPEADQKQKDRVERTTVAAFKYLNCFEQEYAGKSHALLPQLKKDVKEASGCQTPSEWAARLYEKHIDNRKKMG